MRSDALLPPSRPETANADIDRLLHPARYYRRPAEVLTDPALDMAERRAILSSWASDACAVESSPALRLLAEGANPVAFGEVMDALMQLDRPSTRDSSRREDRRRLRERLGSP